MFRARDLPAIGLAPADLEALIERGEVERVTRGLYRFECAALSEHHSLAAVSARVPQAIICLLSALSVHGIGTQLPAEVWIAIPHKARAPIIPEFPLRVVRFSGPSLRYGVESMEFEGIPARVTSVARTVVDCFRFRRLVGLDAAQEAIAEALRDRRASPDEIWRAAEMCRAKSLVGPYLEVLAR
jgi:predicted transcriptional regulator of viral defense system